MTKLIQDSGSLGRVPDARHQEYEAERYALKLYVRFLLHI
jgi:hypothetical protein